MTVMFFIIGMLLALWDTVTYDMIQLEYFTDILTSFIFVWLTWPISFPVRFIKHINDIFRA